MGGLSDRLGAAATPPSWMTGGQSLEELAKRLDIEPKNLLDTLERFNGMALAGRDEDFRRREIANDIWWGDPTLRGSRRPTLGLLSDGQYYAVEVTSGALGTKGVRKSTPMPVGMTYGGAGGTLGPAMVIGYRAGQDAARHAVSNRKAYNLNDN